MPKFRQHAVINTVALTAIEVVLQRKEMNNNSTLKFDWGRLILHVTAGTVAGTLPDLFEPSFNNPNHRSFCHSLAAAVMAWWLVSGRHAHALSPDTRRFLSTLAAGYSLHLGADIFFSRAKGMGLFCAQF